MLLLDDRTEVSRDLEAQSIAHGVILLQQLAPEFGSERRRMRVVKLRGVAFRGGYHDYVIRRGGIEMFPRLLTGDSPPLSRSGQLASGLAGLDSLIGGGLDLGASTLFIGPAGTGKSVLATRFAGAAADRGERVEIFTFDENRELFAKRGPLVGCDISAHLGSGLIRLHQIDPADISPGEFAHRIREQVASGVRLVIIDSINGYLAAMPDEHHLILHLHELCAFCSHAGAAILMLAEQRGIIGPMQMPVDLTYLADTVVLLRHFELAGEVRQAISLLKRRSGGHERHIRELRIDGRGIHVGEPLREYHAVLTGTAMFHGKAEEISPS